VPKRSPAAVENREAAFTSPAQATQQPVDGAVGDGQGFAVDGLLGWGLMP
jgi:hypothetical protein